MRARPIQLAALLASLFVGPQALAQFDTIFTYQGALRESGSAANGAYDIEVSLWDAALGGSQIGSTFSHIDVPVVDGVFTIGLDFGVDVHASTGRWLQLAVNGTTLSPRQAVTAALFSIETRGISVDGGDNVGIGTVVPEAPLHVQEGLAAGGLIAQGNSSAVFERGGQNFVSILSPTTSERGILFGDATSVANGGIVFNNASTTDGLQFRTGGNVAQMYLTSDGHLGLGTDTPIETLHVAGSGEFESFVRASSFSGQFGGSVASNSLGDWNTTAPLFGDIVFHTIPALTALERLRITSGGDVGINITNPAYRLHIIGDAAKPGGGSWTSASDRRLKQNIAPLEGALDRILALRGVTFEYINPDAINELPGQRTGMIAQEVEAVMPGWVDERDDGYKTVTYRGFEAITVEAFRELRAEKDAEIAELTRQIEELRALIERPGTTPQEPVQ